MFPVPRCGLNRVSHPYLVSIIHLRRLCIPNQDTKSPQGSDQYRRCEGVRGKVRYLPDTHCIPAVVSVVCSFWVFKKHVRDQKHTGDHAPHHVGFLRYLYPSPSKPCRSLAWFKPCVKQNGQSPPARDFGKAETWRDVNGISSKYLFGYHKTRACSEKGVSIEDQYDPQTDPRTYGKTRSNS